MHHKGRGAQHQARDNQTRSFRVHTRDRHVRTLLTEEVETRDLSTDIKGKGKGKGHPTTCHEDPEGEKRCSTNL